MGKPFFRASVELFQRLSSVDMWKLLIATAIIVSLGEAQRSSYAGRPGYHSKLLPRFRKNETDSGLGTRGGEESSESASTTTTTTLSPDLQGTLEDHGFVHRVSQWPADRQPFWFKNRNAISTMRGRDIDGGSLEGGNFERRRPQFQSPFQGPGRGRERTPSRFFESDEPFYNGFIGDPFPFYQRRMNYR